MTPLMKQFWDIKTLHQDQILLFRMGDFYEMFFEDAIKAAPILGIALTRRNKKSQDETPMCGVPHHSIAGPINKLLAHGLKVAICDQIEDPKFAKGIVKRAVTRVLTPGMVYDPESLDGSKAHYIASMDKGSLSLVDMTTGEALYFESVSSKDLESLLEALPVAEVVIEATATLEATAGLTKSNQKFVISSHSELASSPTHLPSSALRLLSYVRTLKNDAWEHIRKFEKRELEHRMNLSATVLRHLEVFSTYKGEDQGSLFHAIQRTKTSGGTRLLRQWLQFPLRDLKRIQERLDLVELWRGVLPDLKHTREKLAEVGDLERRLSKLTQSQSQARDLLSLADSLGAALKTVRGVQALYSNHQFLSQALESSNLETLEALVFETQNTLVEDPPLATKQGFMIRKGLFSDLDEYIELSTQSHKKIAEMEAQERTLTGIPSLKIRYNNVFGYYIEITNTHKDKAPSRYQRKQTLSNAERFCTEELIELEKKVLSAQTRRFELEFEIYENLKKKALTFTQQILELSHFISQVDVTTALAWLSLEENYVRPRFCEGHPNAGLKIQGSRHPVVEQVVRKNFVANDLKIPSASCLLLTGPNMAGKSTLMRQVALTSILAQMGCYIPAASAELPLFDAIYTRIGASDQLTEGLSTFMVEMTETSEMLKNATSQSLLILDEVGRGTSTYDGLCLAQGILEYILKEIQAITLFATHYHELTKLENRFPQIHNAHMNVVERDHQIHFLHSLVQGAAGKSYGIHVAELAGIPAPIIAVAQKLLENYELEGASTLTTVPIARPVVKKPVEINHQQLSIFEVDRPMDLN